MVFVDPVHGIFAHGLQHITQSWQIYATVWFKPYIKKSEIICVYATDWQRLS